MKKFVPVLKAILIAVALSVGPAAFGQQAGSILGTVYDPQNAVVPGASITVKDNGTGNTFQAKTTGEGTFTVPGLTFGEYTVTITATGFKESVSKNVRVITAQESDLRVTLQVGAATDSVSVEATAEVINSTSSELTTNVDRKQIVDLPTSTRNPFDFATQMAGVTSTGSATSGSSIMNGLRGSSNNLQQDGIDIRDSFIKTSGFGTNYGYTPSLESTGEFSISGQNLEADSGAGVVQVRLRTARGTNTVHGSLFYFGRNDFFNANTWINNESGTPRSRLRQHRFGGSAGGPVYIPKVYDGRNKTFFYFSYSGFRENYVSTISSTVYTDFARTGVFRYVDASGATQSVNLLTASSRGLGLNSFTSGLINAEPLPVSSGPVAVNPNAGDGLNTLGVRFKVPGTDPSNQYDIRADHKIVESGKWGTHWFEGTYHWLKSPTTPGNTPPFPMGVSTSCTGAVCNSAATNQSIAGIGAGAINSTLSPTLFNEIRGGFNRGSITFLPPAAFPRPYKVNFLTITNPEDNFDPQGRQSPFYTIQDNLTKIVGTHTIKTGFQISSASTHRFNDYSNISGILGGVVPQVTLGTNTGNDNGLNNCAAFPNLPAGSRGTSLCTTAQNLYANVVGLVSNISQTFNGVPNQGYVSGLSDALFLRERSSSFFVQDAWRALPNLTVNVGLRYEVVPAVNIVNQRGLVPKNESLDATPYGSLFTPGTVTFNDLRNNLGATTQLVPGGDANNNPFWKTQYNNFAPSIGVAWLPFDKSTVFRAGYSISYVRDTLTLISNVLSSNTGLHSGLAVSPVAGSSLAVLNPSVNQTLAPPTFNVPSAQYQNFLNGFSSTGASVGIWSFDPNLRTPYVQQWSFGIQRELRPGMALEARYVGNHAVGLYRANDLDQVSLTPAMLTEFNDIASNVLSGTSRPTPIVSQLGVSNSLLTNSTVKTALQQNEAGQFWYLIQSNCTQQFLLKTGCAGLGAFPANYFIANPITGANRVTSNGTSSSYNALQIEFRRALSKGFQVQGNYTFAKVLSNSGITGSQSESDPDLDLRNQGYSRSRADFDIRHTTHWNGVYELPFGKGRQFVNHGILGKALEGWQLGGLFTWRSGIPMTIASARGTVNRTGNSGTNPAVAVGATDSQICSSIGVYKTPGGPFFLPSQYILPGSTAGSSLGANPAYLTNPTAGVLGDQPLRKGACSGPNFSQVDLNIVKKTKLAERLALEIRFEAFNLFNTVNFSPPAAAAINSTGFGTLTSVFQSREMQLNARITF